LKHQNLPGTDRSASVIVLGTAWYGTTIAESDAFAMLDAFVERGGNFLDTANSYFRYRPGGEGKSETTLGAWLKHASRRDVLIGTKGADQGMDRRTIRDQLAESLDRLGTDFVDFYWLHCDDPNVPVGEILGWLNELVDEGRFPAFGCSNWRVARMREAAGYAAANGIRGFAASQIGWSLARVNPQVAGGSQVFMDDETFAYHLETRMPLVGYSAQAGGFFAGKYDPDEPLPGTEPNPAILRFYGTDDNYAKLARVKKLAAGKGCTPNQLATAYLFSQSFPGFAIAGCGNVAQVIDSAGAGDVELTPADVAALEG